MKAQCVLLWMPNRVWNIHVMEDNRIISLASTVQALVIAIWTWEYSYDQSCEAVRDAVQVHE